MMSEKIRLDRKIGFQNTFYTKCMNVIIDSIGPSIILRSILCVHLTQEKVYHSLDVNFLTSDSFASCTDMDIIGNSILRFLILGSKTVKTV